MQYARTIGLFSAVLININIIIGGGAFINLRPMIAAGGSAGFLVYFVGALMLLPVVMVLAALAQRHPESGGLYVYTGTYLHPFIAFLSGWGYFAGKSISVGLIAHLFMQMMKTFFPILAGVPDIVLTAGLIGSFVGVNILGAELQGRVQWIFIAAKAVPVVFAGIVFYNYGSLASINMNHLNGDALNSLLPIAVFAMVGFEVTCTLAHLFKNPQTTIVRALVYGFASAALILGIFQMMVGVLVPAHQTMLFPLAAIANRFIHFPGPLIALLYVCVYTSMLGGAFSILTSNCWNLHRLAEQGHVPFRSLLIKVTGKQVPWVSLSLGGGISVLGVVITQNQGALQSMAIFGMIFSFACAMIAALFARDQHGKKLLAPTVIWAGLASTCSMMYLAMVRIAQVGVSVPYLSLFLTGVVIALFYELSGRRAQIQNNQ